MNCWKLAVHHQRLAGSCRRLVGDGRPRSPSLRTGLGHKHNTNLGFEDSPVPGAGKAGTIADRETEDLLRYAASWTGPRRSARLNTGA
mmetsp:Transcript_61401/g.101470  ORF Transcript_61401/g.101470 Transcript_61401/m.101470 type:complete len:88 (+) Transcript_61401:568-831(+)